MQRFLKAVCLAAMLGTVPACSQILAGGLQAGQALLPITDEQEIQIGRSAAQEVLADPKTPPYGNAEVNAYVDAVGKKVAARSDRSDLPYTFHVIQSDELNAFALPGGEIFITTAALKAMKNEAELAGVLAHEVVHVARKHGVDSLRAAMVAQGITTAALGSTPAMVQQAGKIAASLVLKGYSRGLESDADHYGAIYSNAAGYDPRGLGSFLTTLAQTVGDTPKAFEAFGDHPVISERVAALDAEITKLGLNARSQEAESFLSRTAPLR
ncbi:M48 family metalloprotease [bacterium]|nr:M48 family metalloprotease [bacterium]